MDDELDHPDIVPGNILLIGHSRQRYDQTLFNIHERVEEEDGIVRIRYSELNRRGRFFPNDTWTVGQLLSGHHIVRTVDEAEWVAARLSDGNCWPD